MQLLVNSLEMKRYGMRRDTQLNCSGLVVVAFRQHFEQSYLVRRQLPEQRKPSLSSTGAARYSRKLRWSSTIATLISTGEDSGVNCLISVFVFIPKEYLN